MKTIEDRLEQVEARLVRIEQLLPSIPVPRSADADTAAQVAEAAAADPVQVSRPPVTAQSLARQMADPDFRNASVSHSLSVTQILGWTGATALVQAEALALSASARPSKAVVR